MADDAAMRYDNTQFYLISWVRLLHALLGWAEARVLAWVHACGHWKRIHDPDHIIFHAMPSYWARHLLIPDSLRARLPHERWLDLLGDLQSLFAEEDRQPHRDPTAIDWQRYKVPYEQLLATYIDELQNQSDPSL